MPSTPRCAVDTAITTPSTHERRRPRERERGRYPRRVTVSSPAASTFDPAAFSAFRFVVIEVL